MEEREVFRIALSGGHTPEPLFRLLAHKDWWNACPGKKSASSGWMNAALALTTRKATTDLRGANCFPGFRQHTSSGCAAMKIPERAAANYEKTAARGIQAGFQRNSTLRPDAAGHGRGWPHCFNFPQFPAAA